MESICGLDCCGQCSRKEACGGCKKANGRPFGGRCIAAEYIQKEGMEAFQNLKRKLVKEFNALGIPGLHVEDLNLLNGFFVNLEYPLANGTTVRLLKDENIYLGNQIEMEGSDRCYGIIADDTYLLVCDYQCNGSNPRILCYKRREEKETAV